MKAIEITASGAPEVLRLAERPMPVAGAGEVLIRVAASGVNRPDVLQRKGHYPVPPGASDIPGLEVAGEIVAATPRRWRAAGFKVGDRVCALVAGGGYAELCVAPVGAVPAGARRARATSRRPACPRPSSPSGRNVFDRGRLQPGETLLIQGGTQRHRRHRDPAGQGARRDRDRHRRQRRQVRGLPGARRRPRHQLQDATTSPTR